MVDILLPSVRDKGQCYMLACLCFCNLPSVAECLVPSGTDFELLSPIGVQSIPPVSCIISLIRSQLLIFGFELQRFCFCFGTGGGGCAPLFLSFVSLCYPRVKDPAGVVARVCVCVLTIDRSNGLLNRSMLVGVYPVMFGQSHTQSLKNRRKMVGSVAIATIFCCFGAIER